MFKLHSFCCLTVFQLVVKIFLQLVPSNIFCCFSNSHICKSLIFWGLFLVTPLVTSHRQSIFQEKPHFKFDISQDHNEVGHHLVEAICFGSYGQQCFEFWECYILEAYSHISLYLNFRQ